MNRLVRIWRKLFWFVPQKYIILEYYIQNSIFESSTDKKEKHPLALKPLWFPIFISHNGFVQCIEKWKRPNLLFFTQQMFFSTERNIIIELFEIDFFITVLFILIFLLRNCLLTNNNYWISDEWMILTFTLFPLLTYLLTIWKKRYLKNAY